jgi:hypothetical protein
MCRVIFLQQKPCNALILWKICGYILIFDYIVLTSSAKMIVYKCGLLLSHKKLTRLTGYNTAGMYVCSLPGAKFE